MLLIPAALLGVGTYHLATRYDSKVQQLDSKMEEINRRIPVSNRYDTSSKTAFLQQGQPLRVIPDTDLRGVPMYHVDWGSGARTRSYTTPVWTTGDYSLGVQ